MAMGVFADEIEAIGGRVEEFEKGLLTEEATKTAIVMPFIGRVLGYDVFDPNEVVPEFVADVGLKRGEKIDYALCHEGAVQILIEVKKISERLDVQHASQLFRYFHSSSARIGVLTNGRQWQFFTDLDRSNVMDDRPFLQLDLMSIDPYVLPELKKLTKSTFDVDSVVAAAEELRYVGGIKRVLAAEFENPSEDLVRLLTARVYDGKLVQKVRDQFAVLCAKALRQFINDQVNDRLRSALQGSSPAITPPVPDQVESDQDDAAVRDDIETTMDEMEGFHIVRAIAVAEIPVERVTFRDTKSYCGILIDDNNRKPVCRLHFNRSQRYLGLLDEQKQESRIPIGRLEDLYGYSEEIREAVRRYR